MDEFWLGDLKLHRSLNFNLRNPIEGLESPKRRMGTYDRAGEDGGVLSSSFYGMRQVVLVGRVSGSNAAQFEDNRLALIQACALQRDAAGYPVLTRCSVTTVSGRQYYFYAQVSEPVFSFENINWSSFMLQLLAPDPQIYGEDQVDSGLIGLPTPTGITWPITWPITFGGIVGGRLTASNPGSMFTWPVIRLRGPLTNPFIYNVTTGKVMQLNTVIPAGSFVDIYMGDAGNTLGKRIMLNGVDSLIAAKTSDSVWWALDPGDNVIAFSSGSSGDSGTLQLTFNPAYVGI